MSKVSIDRRTADRVRRQLLELQELRTEELADAAARYAEMEQRVGVSVDEAASRFAEAQVARVRAEAAEDALFEIEEALRRLDRGRYGVCETCLRTIPAERLEVLPATRHCVSCQRAARHH